MNTPMLMVALMLLPIWIPLIGATLGAVSDRVKRDSKARTVLGLDA